jgi:hypothetical protein
MDNEIQTTFDIEFETVSEENEQELLIAEEKLNDI